ncbi:unnamed protein product [Calypogeia fissa]
MAASLVCCGCGEGLAAAAGAGGTLRLETRSSRPLPSFGGLSGRSCRFPFSPSLEKTFFGKRNVDVRVAADHSDSKPDSHKRQGKWGYHPLEDLSKLEKEEIENAGDGRLSTAEVARTIAEVNWSAFIFSTVVSDKDAVFGTEVQYLVDDHGDLYFEIENDNEFLRNLSATQIYTVMVGFGNLDGLQFSEVIEAEAEEVQAESDSEDSSDEGDDIDVQIYWEGIEESDDGSPEESFSSLGGWGGFESLDQVHPMDFASKVSESVLADYTSEIDNPARRLTITGVARPVTEEEEPYVQGIWYDRFLLAGGDDDDDEDEGKHSHDANGGLLSRNKSKNALHNRGMVVEEVVADSMTWEPERPGFSQNGVVPGKSLNGTDRILDENVSSSDYSLLDFPSTSGSKADDLDKGREDHREDSDGHELRIVSRDLGKRKRRNMKGGTLLDGSSDVKDEALEMEEAAEILLPPGATLEGDAVVGEWSEQRQRALEIGSSFYKFEIVSIQLDTGPGTQTLVEVQDFAFAEPDVLAHFSSTIMERVNSGGKKIENALKALCQRAKGLDVEEVSLVGVDCLGLDLRVRCGIEVQTLRIPFSRRATCEETADKLIDQLLFPRNGQRRSKRNGHDWKSH